MIKVFIHQQHKNRKKGKITAQIYKKKCEQSKQKLLEKQQTNVIIDTTKAARKC